MKDGNSVYSMIDRQIKEVSNKRPPTNAFKLPKVRYSLSANCVP